MVEDLPQVKHFCRTLAALSVATDRNDDSKYHHNEIAS